ncbi:MAG TPA: asparagine synthase (glutamine-hydrolyzing) [Thermoanaerobaculia bacterium]|jgi:asparagine synthase (glutamine-hydrolysing)|nr:asparagine synthase (glutamine-hydrolyzing) [Thermoanaerobaculia bacterium]
MCGISGVITKEPTATTLLANVRRMNAAQIHRGPDGEGEHHHAHALLAMRRLSIIDPIGGDQPLYNEDRSIVAIANGEIYNFPDLRADLQRAGHTFRTGSDCETIVHLYEEHGLDCVQYLRGMFAFALWDATRRRLVLARDRMGEKPLYLHEQPGQLLFASELKSLLHSNLVPFTLDPQSIDNYFHYQFVPEPHTPLRDVRKLEAAHLLTIDVDPWKVEDRCYWRMEDAPPIHAEPTIVLRECLEDTGRIVTRADRNVGIALSGGLDSSLLAALAAKTLGPSLSAFSVGYRSRPHSDERHDAQALAQSLGLPFHEIELDTQTVVDFFPELNYWRDDPIADIAGHGYYAVMQLAREHNVPVMLQGQGGDELFWGYPALREAAIASHAKRKRQNWLRPLRPTGRMILYDRLSDYRAAAEMRDHYVPRFASQIDPAGAGNLFTFARPWPNIDVTMTRLVSDTYLRANGIAQGDRLSMASGVEMRVPLVDHKLVETIIGLRKHRSDLRLPPKTWLRESVRDLLPDYVLDRPKRGFEPPTLEWHDAIFAAHGRSLINGALVSEGVLRPESAAYFAKGPFPNNATCPLSFKALVLEQWLRQMRSRCTN